MTSETEFKELKQSLNIMRGFVALLCILVVVLIGGMFINGSEIKSIGDTQSSWNWGQNSDITDLLNKDIAHDNEIAALKAVILAQNLDNNELETRITALEECHQPTFKGGGLVFIESGADELICSDKPLKGGPTEVELNLDTDKWLELREYAENLSYDECLRFDYYAESNWNNTETPRINEDGAEFRFSCETFFSGWFFEGEDDHRWSLSLSEEQLNTILNSSTDYYKLPLAEFGSVPTNLVNPGYPDLNPLTLDDLQSGTVACVNYSRSNTDGSTVTINESPYMRANIYDYGEYTDIHSYVSFDYTNESGIDTYMAAGDWGIMPHTDGLWSSAFLTEGPCPS